MSFLKILRTCQERYFCLSMEKLKDLQEKVYLRSQILANTGTFLVTSVALTCDIYVNVL